MCDENQKVLAIAAEHIRKNLPYSTHVLSLPSVVADNGDMWTVTYQLPPDTAGGTPVLTIDKTTCKVVRVLRYQ